MQHLVLPFFEPSQSFRNHLQLFESCQCNPRPRSTSVKGTNTVAFSSPSAEDSLSTSPTFRKTFKPITTSVARVL